MARTHHPPASGPPSLLLQPSGDFLLLGHKQQLRPPGLCTCRSHEIMHTACSLDSFQSLFKLHKLREAFPDHPITPGPLQSAITSWHHTFVYSSDTPLGRSHCIHASSSTCKSAQPAGSVQDRYNWLQGVLTECQRTLKLPNTRPDLGKRRQ